MLLDALIGDDANLSKFFKIHLVSTLTKPTGTTETRVAEQLLSLEVAKDQDGKLNLGTCLANYFKQENLSDYKDQTGKVVQATKQLSLDQSHRPPPILTIHFKRSHFDNGTSSKINDAIPFGMNIDFGGEGYHLIGIIVHDGNSLTSGHYWAYTKDRFLGHWYKFDDMNRSRKFEHNIQAIAEKGLDEQDTPYMLFYERKR